MILRDSDTLWHCCRIHMANDQSNAGDTLLSPKEVRQVLNVGRSALYEWIARRELPYYKLGRLIRIKKSDLDEFLKRQRVERYE